MLSLVGHYNIFGEYPAPVVPVCRDERGRYFAIYVRGGRIRPVQVPPDDVVRHAEPAAERLGNFRPATDRLLALAPDEVEAFPRADEPRVLYRFIAQGVLRGSNPLLLVSLAARTGNRAAVISALRASVAELGGLDAYTDEWYRQVRAQLLRRRRGANLDLPPTALQLVADSSIVSIGSPPEFVPLLRTLARLFNADPHQEPGARLALVSVLDYGAAPPADGGGDATRVDAFVAEADSGEIEDVYHESIPFCQGVPVLALNPAFAREMGLTRADWKSVAERAARFSDFRWIRPRSTTDAGAAFDALLLDAFGGADPDSYDDLVRTLEQRVVRYCRTDAETLATAFEEGRWRVSAFVAHEHSVRFAASDLPEDQRPHVISPPSSDVGVLYSIRYTPDTRRGAPEAITRFAESLGSDEVRDVMSAYGVRAGVTSVAAWDRARAAAQANARRQRPLAVLLVTDTSGSMSGTKLTEAGRSMAAFLGRLVGYSRDDQLGFITFANTAQVVVPLQPISASADAVYASIDSLRAEGRTALLDALVLAWSELIAVEGYLRTIVVLTDGHENGSRTTLNELLSVLHSRPPYTVAIFGLAYGGDADLEFLRRCSLVTGGTTDVGSLATLNLIFAKLAANL